MPDYYSYDFKEFNNWFNGVLLRSYVDIYPKYEKAIDYINSFQRNLDYGYDNYLEEGILPYDLLEGWGQRTSDNNVEALSSFALATQYAVLSQIQDK